jgi:tetratricopeptide (TPR) repeat protein
LPSPSSYALAGVTFQLQTWNNCGPANLAMGLSYYGLTLTQKETAEYLKPNREDKNVSPEQMVSYVNQFTDLRALYRVAGNLDQLRWLASNNFMVIVETAYSTPQEGWLGHYRTLVGYDDGKGEFHFYDSNYGRAASPMIPEPAAKFDSEWQAFNRTYIVIYNPTRETELRDFLGRDWNEIANWRYAAEVARQEAAAAPDNAFAWFNLGSALTELGDYSTASQAFDQAFNLGLPWRMLWYQFGPYEAYFQSTRFDDVVVLAETTIKTTPYVEESYYYLGRVYEVRGDLEAARSEYAKAVDFNPNFYPASQALARVGGAS